MGIDLEGMTIAHSGELLRKKKISSVELTQAYLEKTEAQNKTLNVYLEVFSDALQEARARDIDTDGQRLSPLHGIPLAIKDNILIRGKQCSAASQILSNYTAAYDATVIGKLREAGAVFLGRTNMDEFAMGGSTEHSRFGSTKNPHDPERVPGGSSGGSAAAVAAHLAPGALGSDTGGSVRQPAAFSGVVGLKPTYGAVSRYGLIAMASSFDQIGPITKTVSDARIIYDVIRGSDPRDSTSVSAPPKKEHARENRTLGVPEQFLTEGVDQDVLDNFNTSIGVLKNLGYTIRPIELPSLKYALPVYYIVMPAEASSNLSRFDAVRYGSAAPSRTLLEHYEHSRGRGFGAEVRRRILLGTYILSAGYYDAYYTKAEGLRRHIRIDFENVYKEVDAVLMPTSPTPAFKLGEKSHDPVQMYLSDIFTVAANLTGHPAISIPSGTVVREEKVLPLGLQMMGPAWSEEKLFEIGERFEFALHGERA